MDSITQITTYVLTLALAAFLPGPGMTGLMFKTLSQGYKKGLTMLLGLITGDMIFLLISIFFISYIAQLNSDIFFYMMMISSLYLLYLSYKFWIFDDNLLEISMPETIKETFSSYINGLLITLSNPKTISFYLALVPTILGTTSLQKQSLFLVPITIFTLAVVGGIYIFFSLKLKNVLKSMKIQKILLRSLSSLMCFLALGMFYSELVSRYLV